VHIGAAARVLGCPGPRLPSDAQSLVRIKAADNILDANSALTFAQWPETPSQEPWTAIKGQQA